LQTRIAALVRKAQRTSRSPWIERSERAIASLVLAAFKYARPELSDAARKQMDATAKTLVAELHELGWGEQLARFEARIAAAYGSNLPPHGPLGRAGRRLLDAVRDSPPEKN
jgi:hypothetical protein